MMHLISILLVLLFSVGIAAAAPVKIIFDTDFRTDVDDPGTLAMLHGLWNDGRAEVIGAIASTAGSNVVGAIDAVNTHFRRPDIPVGLIAPARASGGGDPYAPTLADTGRYPSDQANAAAPDSTALYRRLLDAAEGGSVVIVVTGGQNAVCDLMASGTNHNGDGIAATGIELARSKVCKLVIMGGDFASPTTPENNILRGVAAAQQVAALWPTPIVYSGWEVGSGVLAGKALSNPDVNPVAKAYELFSGSGGVGVIGDRDCWDQTAALYAVVGLTYNGQTLWSLSAPKDVTFDSAGRTITTPSETSTRYFLIKTLSDAGLAAIISDLMTAEPGGPPVAKKTYGAYRPDAHTLLLYHFDEAGGASDTGAPFANAGSAGPAFDLTNTGGPDGRDNSSSTGCGYGAAAFQGLGSAFDVLRSGNGTYHTTASATGGGALTAGAVSQGSLQGADGAFTYETLATFSNGTDEQQMLSMDGGTTRGFLFRVTGGTLSFYTGSAEFKVPLPASGDHAFAPHAWFHAAVTYTGAAGAADNLNFYWTRLSASAAVANLIGSATLPADLSGSVSNTFGVGTTSRNRFRYECETIDEVRVSDVARTADQFQFGIAPLSRGTVIDVR